MPTEGRHYILLDEVTYIAGWDKGIKYLADAGLLAGVVLIATGSDRPGGHPRGTQAFSRPPEASRGR